MLSDLKIRTLPDAIRSVCSMVKLIVLASREHYCELSQLKNPP